MPPVKKTKPLWISTIVNKQTWQIEEGLHETPQNAISRWFTELNIEVDSLLCLISYNGKDWSVVRVKRELRPIVTVEDVDLVEWTQTK